MQASSPPTPAGCDGACATCDLHERDAFLPLSDAAVLLVRWQSTPRAAVAQTIDTLAALRVPATGVVFAR